jgi:transposase
MVAFSVLSRKKLTMTELNSSLASKPALPPLLYAIGIDVGSLTCSVCIMRTDKTVVGKPLQFPNSTEGQEWLNRKLVQLGCERAQLCVGLEATSRYGENLQQYLIGQGYPSQLLNPIQTYQYAKRRGMRAKTDKIDAELIARFVLSGDARPAYVPNELITTYRELIRLHTNLADEATRYKNELRALLEVLFPEFTQVFADPSASTALALLQRYPSAEMLVAAGVEQVYAVLHELAPRRYGRGAAQRLVALAETSQASPLAHAARSTSLRVICDQLAHTQTNLMKLEEELAHLLQSDKGVESLASVPEFGQKVRAVLRGELGEVERFGRGEQVVAYVGLDLVIKESGKWKDQPKISKRGSGLLRRVLYMAVLHCLRMKESAFKDYYQAMVARGLRGRKAIMGVMRKMLLVAYHLYLLKSGETYDPTKVWAVPKAETTAA